jgi:glycosyltransferase involved in cell wall biosynthesis
MISVCIATYNGQLYLAEQLDSILKQLKQEDELIISDDGSTDATLSILKEYQKNYPQICLLQGPRQGVIANFEGAIQQAKGDIIFLADQDDVWLPGKVATVCEQFASAPKTQVIISDLTIVDETLHPLAPSYFAFRKVKSGFIRNLLRNGYIGAGMAFRKDLKPLILPIPPSVPMHDMWIGLLGDLYGKNQFLPQPFTLYRRHEHNVSEIKTQASKIQQLKWRATILFLLIKRKFFHWHI